MNARRNPTCTKAEWFGVSAMSGSDMDGAELSIVRFRGSLLMQRGDLDGRVYPTCEAAFSAAEAHGYLHRYGRNTLHFVQSRAARRRGFAPVNTDSWAYRTYCERARKGGAK